MTDQPTPNPAYIEAVQQMVATAAYPSLIGMTLSSMEYDAATITLAIDERHMQPYGIVHGGVVATLLDTATFWAGFVRLPADTGLVNVDLRLNYLEALPPDVGTVRCVGRCLRPGRSLSYTEAHLYDASGRLLAHGNSTLMALPGRGLPIDLPKFLA